MDRAGFRSGGRQVAALPGPFGPEDFRGRGQPPVAPIAGERQERVINPLGPVADAGPEDMQAIAAQQHGRVPGRRVKGCRARLEGREAVARAQELIGMGQGIGPAAMAEDAEIGRAEQGGADLEGETVPAQRHARPLFAVRQQAVEIHADPLVVRVDMDVRRGDMGIEPVDPALRPVRGGPRRWRTLGAEEGVGHVERARAVDAPGAFERMGVGQSDVRALVVGEVEVVAAQRPVDPGRGPYHGGAVDVVAHAGIHVRADDGLRQEAARGDRHGFCFPLVRVAAATHRLRAAAAAKRPSQRYTGFGASRKVGSGTTASGPAVPDCAGPVARFGSC